MFTIYLLKLINNLGIENRSQPPSTKRSHITTKGFTPYTTIETTSTPSRALEKGKRITIEPPKRLEGKECPTCHGYGHFQGNCPNSNIFTIREVEEI